MTTNHNSASKLQRQHPHLYVLDPQKPAGVHAFLVKFGIVSETTKITSIEKAGDGNMNCTLRIHFDNAKSLIMKQSRPWVEKYPMIPAPAGRVLVETAFYRQISSNPVLANLMPHVLYADKASNTLVLQDLGKVKDATYLYKNSQNLPDFIKSNSRYLQQLHGLDIQNMPSILTNRDMLELQAFHMFTFPLQPHDHFDLESITPGLTKFANQLKNNDDYVDQCNRLKEIYLSKGDTLIHGDFHPGSWMHTENSIKYLDPEFCCIGRREFDLGIMIAHYGFIQKDIPNIEKTLSYYEHDFDTDLVKAFAGVEWMRRLIGVAQIPLEMDLAAKAHFLESSKRWILL